MCNEMFSDNPTGVCSALGSATVGVAGAGGIGSNVCIALTRAGIRRLVVVDMDTVELRNLNRQQYYLDQVGEVKVRALAVNLLRINPDLRIETHETRIEPDNACSLFEGCDVLVEALDSESEKVMLLEAWLSGMGKVPVVACSGLAGSGRTGLLKVDRRNNLTIVGDQASELELGTLSSRVAIVANMMANEVIQLMICSE